MLFMRRKLQTAIILAIIAVSVYSAVQITGIPKRGVRTVELDLREPRRVFEQSINNRKTIINYLIADAHEISSQFNQILTREGTNVYFNNRDRSHFVAVFDTPKEQEASVLEKLRQIDGLSNEKTETALTKPGGIIDINSHVRENELVKERYRERLKNPHLTTREIGELQFQIRTIQTKIDSLNSVKELEEVKTNPLYFIIARTHSGNMAPTKHIKQYGQLLFVTLAFILLYTLAALLITYSFTAISKLMKLSGIKTSKSGGSRYSYGYGYSYANKRKKKKHRSQPVDEPKEEEEDK